jgi:phage major head subunit gpT-like protein
VLNELTSDTEWYLMDTRRALKPFIFQERKAPEMVMLTEVTSENVFQRKEFIYGVDARGAAGYGLWFLAAKAAA